MPLTAAEPGQAPRHAMVEGTAAFMLVSYRVPGQLDSEACGCRVPPLLIGANRHSHLPTEAS